jgi:hypothetical protein
MPVLIIDGLDSLGHSHNSTGSYLIDKTPASDVPLPLFHKLLFCLRVYCGRQYRKLFLDPETQSHLVSQCQYLYTTRWLCPVML